MIWLLCATLIIIGLVLLGIGIRQNARLPAALKVRLLNEEVMGVALILAGVWTLAVYGIVEIWR